MKLIINISVNRNGKKLTVNRKAKTPLRPSIWYAFAYHEVKMHEQAKLTLTDYFHVRA